MLIHGLFYFAKNKFIHTRKELIYFKKCDISRFCIKLQIYEYIYFHHYRLTMRHLIGWLAPVTLTSSFELWNRFTTVRISNGSSKQGKINVKIMVLIFLRSLNHPTRRRCSFVVCAIFRRLRLKSLNIHKVSVSSGLSDCFREILPFYNRFDR